jgi:glycolate oxidase FAD binding subunit
MRLARGEEGSMAPRNEQGEEAGTPSGLGELERLGIQVGWAERPKDEAGVLRVVSRAAREGLTVFPVGGGTSLGVAMLPEAVDIALDMTGLDRIMSVDSGNLNLSLQAGKPIDAVNQELASVGRGFFLPLDPPVADRATVGGAYAANVSGPVRLLYGSLRDLALGVRAIDARGKELSFGGVTVKNVSGYDMTKFLIGSAGSLCVVTGISLRMFPVPQASSLCRVEFEGVQAAERFLAGLRASVLVPSAVVMTGPLDGEAGVRVLTAFEGHPKAVERQDRDLLHMAEACGGRGGAGWGREPMLLGLKEAVDPIGVDGSGLTLKGSVPMVHGPAACTSLIASARRAGLKGKVALLANNGILYLHTEADGDGSSGIFCQEAKEIMLRLGGHSIPLRGPKEILSSWGPRIDPALTRLVLRPIKERLDPKGVFLSLV